MYVELQKLKQHLFVENAVKNIKFFPGTDRDVSPEDFAREINKFFASSMGVNVDTEITSELDV